MATSTRQRAEPVPNEERRRWSTQHILDIAQQQIIRLGYVAATMDRIAAHSELTKGAVYFYFPSKEALLHALIDRAENTYYTPALALLQQKEGGASARLAAYFNYAGASMEHGRYLLLLTLSIQQDSIPQSAHERILALFERIHLQLSGVIEQGITADEFETTNAPEAHASHITATMDGMLLEWERRKAQIDGREFMRVSRSAILMSLKLRQ